MDRQRIAKPADRRVLGKTYEVMRRLREEGRDHIWGYVARNLARPVWVAAKAQKADAVVGNPPWVSYRYMNPDFQGRFRAECRAAKLWVGGKVATQQDLSGYFYMRAAVLYMRPTGRIALVMPYAALSRQAYAGFRKGEAAKAGHIALRLRFTGAWTFGPEVQPLFPVPSCVLFAEVHDRPLAAPLPDRVTAFAGALPRRDADEAGADSALTATAAGWPADAAVERESPYRRRFRQGATLVPRRLVFVEPAQTARMLPPDPAVPLVRGRTGTLDKAPWKTLEPPQGAIEQVFLRPVLLGEAIAPFRILAPATAVIPWDKNRRDLMDAARADQRGWQFLAHWLKRTEALWDRHKRTPMSLLEQCDYYGKLSRQFPIAPVRVVYAASGTHFAAAASTAKPCAPAWSAISLQANGARVISRNTFSTCRSRCSTSTPPCIAASPTPRQPPKRSRAKSRRRSASTSPAPGAASARRSPNTASPPSSRRWRGSCSASRPDGGPRWGDPPPDLPPEEGGRSQVSRGESGARGRSQVAGGKRRSATGAESGRDGAGAAGSYAASSPTCAATLAASASRS